MAKTSKTEEQGNGEGIINLSDEDLLTLSEALGIPRIIERATELELAFSDLAIYTNRLHEMYMKLIGEPMVTARIEAGISNGTFKMLRQRGLQIPESILDPTAITKNRKSDPLLEMVHE